MATPADYGLPHEEFRPGQEEAIEQALAVQPGEYLALEMGTGSGKTSCAAAVAFHQPTTYLADKIMLLDQSSQKYGFQTVYGRERYECPYLNLTADACAFSASMRECPELPDCSYFWTRQACMASRRRALSYAYYWAAGWPKEAPGKLFCDEAQVVPDRFLDLAALEMMPRTREFWNLPDFPSANGMQDWAKQAVSDWSLQAQAKLPGRSRVPETRLGTYDRLQHKLESIRGYLEEGDWYIQSSLEKLSARPLTPAPFAGFLKQTDGLVFMSATVPETLADELGLENLKRISFPHPIPAERRPVYFVSNAPKMTASATAWDFEYQGAIIAKILHDLPATWRGLIHVSRWAETHALKERLMKYGVPEERLWIPNPGPSDQQALAFTQDTTPGLIALAPNWREGLDLHDDLARIVLVAKTPFLFWGDPYVQARATRPKIGKRWYDADACTATVQGCGRVVRSAEDFGIAYIVDASWTRVRKYAPAWFRPQEVIIEP